MKHIEQYFKSYPNSQKVFETSDGLLFHEEGDANLHAKSLENKSVKGHISADYLEKLRQGDAAATAAAINQSVGKKSVNEEDLNEGNDEEAVKMAAAAEMQSATLETISKATAEEPPTQATKKQRSKASVAETTKQSPKKATAKK